MRIGLFPNHGIKWIIKELKLEEFHSFAAMKLGRWKANSYQLFLFLLLKSWPIIICNLLQNKKNRIYPSGREHFIQSSWQRWLNWEWTVLPRRHTDIAYERTFLCSFLAWTDQPLAVCLDFLTVPSPTTLDSKCLRYLQRRWYLVLLPFGVRLLFIFTPVWIPGVRCHLFRKSWRKIR